jgi:hypothetical protein
VGKMRVNDRIVAGNLIPLKKKGTHKVEIWME